MTLQTSLKSRDPLGLTAIGCVLATALSAVTGCDAISGTRESAAALTTTSPSRFVARPRQHLMFTAAAKAPAADVEAYYKAYILPAIIRDRRIGEVAITAERDGRYLVDIELRTATAADQNFAFDVLAAGKTDAEAERILRGFAALFDITSARQLTPRGDLSIARSIVGSVTGGAP